jgi:uncharacterized protein (TIGR00369 family)
MTTDYLSRAREALQEQMFSRLLGTEIHAFDARSIDMRLPITDDLGQNHGFVHGGVISYLADNAMTFIGSALLDGGGVASEMKINFVRPAIGQLLIARASVLSAGRSQAVCRCDVFAAAEGVEKLCAAAQGTVAKLGQQKRSVSPDVD